VICGWNRSGDDSESYEPSIRRHAAQPDRVGNGDAFGLGEPVAERHGGDVIVAHARNVRLIGESRKKDDRLDARTLARLARIDAQLLCPVKHHSARAQADPTVIRGEPGWCEHDRAGKHGPRIGQALWRAAARVQRTQYESGESPGG
jgi:hypothetical protein